MKTGFLITSIILFILYILGLFMLPFQFLDPLYWMIQLIFLICAIIFIIIAFKKDSKKKK